MVKLLVENGADIHFNDDFPIHHAAANGRFTVIKYLIEKGVDVCSDNNYALRVAFEHGSLHAVKYLVEKGADDSILPPFTRKTLLFTIKMEQTRRVWAANKIYFWWIPICYDVNRECGKRMMERSWKRVEEMYAEIN
jgi:ankyrin repeat protein